MSDGASSQEKRRSIRKSHLTVFAFAVGSEVVTDLGGKPHVIRRVTKIQEQPDDQSVVWADGGSCCDKCSSPMATPVKGYADNFFLLEEVIKTGWFE